MVDRRALVAGPLLVAAGAIGVLAFDPFADHAIGCPLHEMTGLLCPGCGATRASWLLLHGDLAAVVRHNLLFLPALVVLVARWLHLALPDRTGWLPGFARSPTDIRPVVLRALVVVLVTFSVARNLPAFEWLAPPASR